MEFSISEGGFRAMEGERLLIFSVRFESREGAFNAERLDLVACCLSGGVLMLKVAIFAHQIGSVVSCL